MVMLYGCSNARAQRGIEKGAGKSLDRSPASWEWRSEGRVESSWKWGGRSDGETYAVLLPGAGVKDKDSWHQRRMT